MTENNAEDQRGSAPKLLSSKLSNSLYSLSGSNPSASTKAGPENAGHSNFQPAVWFGCAMLIMLWFGIGYQIRSEYSAKESAIHQDLRNFGHVFEEHVVRTVRELDKALLMMRDRYLKARQSVSYEEAIGRALPNPQLLSDMSFQLATIDRDGLLRATTMGKHPPKLIDLKDRAHFQIHKSTTQDVPNISIPVLGRRSGRWSVQLTRRILGPEGSFDGVMVASMNPAHFARFYGSIDFGKHGTVVLAGTDGIVRATVGSQKLKLGSDVARTDLLKNSGKGNGIYLGDMDGSGLARIFSLHHIPGQPLFIAVGVSPREAFAAAHNNRIRYLVVGVIFTLLIAAAVFASMRHHRHIHAARLKIVASQERAEQKSLELSLTLENMAEGIIMVGSDRRIVVVNEKFQQMLEAPKEVSGEGRSFDELLAFFVDRGEYNNIDRDVRSDILEKLLAPSNSEVCQYLERTRPDGTVLAIKTRGINGSGFVRTFTDITEQHRSEKKIAHLARHDHLTNLANRAQFRERLDFAIAELANGRGFSILFLDLDHFKIANDTYGHSFGDTLLVNVGERMRRSLRRGDVVARLGGDEFAMIIFDVTDPAKITARANQLIEVMRAPFVIDGRQIVVNGSIGGAIAPRDAIEAEEILKNADLALYKAKSDGRDCFRAFDPELAYQMTERRELENDLSYALDRNELVIHYQPLTSVQGGTISGFEALLRWEHPTKGRIPPLDFIPLAEDNGLILPIGAWVLEKACLQAATWADSMRVAINLSPVQFRDPYLIDKIRGALNNAGLPPERLELEITESVMMQNGDETIETLREISDLGVKISMDDFGTGYSSLSYLRNFSFDTLKIDRSFVNELGRDEGCEPIVRAIIGLADCLGVSTTAEGVETEEQLEILTEMGCNEAQGFLFSPPRPADDLPTLLAQSVFQLLAASRKQEQKKIAS